MGAAPPKDFLHGAVHVPAGVFSALAAARQPWYNERSLEKGGVILKLCIVKAPCKV